MARKLSEPQADELAEFVRELRRVGKFPTWVDFARAANFPATNLSDVQLGKAGIDGLNLLSLIQAAARRAEQQPAEVAIAAAPSSLEDRLEEVSAMVTEGFALLAAGIADVARRLPGADLPGTGEGQPQ